MGLLENAAEWLESQRIRELSIPIVYQRRGGETLNIPATPGRTLFRAENEYGVTIRTETRDFLIAAEDLPDDPNRRCMMPDTPDHRDLWHELNQARLDIAELRGMLSMHFSEGQHHYPPCKPAADLQKTMLSSLAAALIALLAAVGNIIMEFIRR